MYARTLPWLLALAVVRAAFPLLALAFGGALPGFPDYDYEGPRGDASGYIDTARAIISAAAGLRLLLPVLLALAVAGLVGARWAWRRYPGDRHWVIAGVAALAFCLLAVVILNVEGQAPAGAVGWPLVLSLPLLPFRAVGWIDDEVAVGVGVALAIAANTVTILATAFIGWRLTASRWIGVAAAALFAFWPSLTWLLVGERTWFNSAWEIEAGLELYTEPLSTACVATGIALTLVRARPPWALVTAGIVLGYAIAVRPTNLVFAAAAMALLAWDRDWRGVRRFVVGGLTVLPIVVAFLPKKRGYDLELARDQTGLPLWSNDYLFSSFTDSSLWRPGLLLLLLPFVAVGVVASRSRPVALMLLAGALANAVIYAFFRATWEHPRYLHAGLPALLVLWTAGVAYAADYARRAREVAHVRSS